MNEKDDFGVLWCSRSGFLAAEGIVEDWYALGFLQCTAVEEGKGSGQWRCYLDVGCDIVRYACRREMSTLVKWYGSAERGLELAGKHCAQLWQCSTLFLGQWHGSNLRLGCR